jgi:hypothetical protein
VPDGRKTVGTYAFFAFSTTPKGDRMTELETLCRALADDAPRHLENQVFDILAKARELHELLTLARAALREAPDPSPSMRAALVAIEAQTPALTDAQITAGAAIPCASCRKPIGRNIAIDVWHAMT